MTNMNLGRPPVSQCLCKTSEVTDCFLIGNMDREEQGQNLLLGAAPNLYVKWPDVLTIKAGKDSNTAVI